MVRKHRVATLAVLVGITTLVLTLLQGVSAAHHPEISARAECIPTNTARLTLDVAAWDDPSPARRTHNDVVVTLEAAGYDNTFHGQFAASNNFSFTVTVDVPADGKTYTAVASTNEYWGPNGEIVIPIGPQSRSTTVTAPMPCPAATTTTTSAPTTTASTTTASTTTASTTSTSTTIGVNVQGVVETVPTTTAATTTVPTATAAPGTAVQGAVLARTGTNTTPFALIGLALVLIGTAVELNGRRRRHI